MKCRKCGKEIPDDAQFCQFCGKEQEDYSPAGLLRKEVKKSKLTSMILLFICVLLFILCGAFSNEIAELNTTVETQKTYIADYSSKIVSMDSEIDKLKTEAENNIDYKKFLESIDGSSYKPTTKFYCLDGNVIFMKKGESKRITIHMGGDGEIGMQTSKTYNGNCVKHSFAEFNSSGNIDVILNAERVGMDLIELDCEISAYKIPVLVIVTE